MSQLDNVVESFAVLFGKPMPIRIALLAVATLFASAWWSPTEARRVALVIGNANYARVPKLANPARDSGAVTALLRSAGFELVEQRSDLGLSAMRRALRDFADQVRTAEIAVVYFAGHGIEVNGTNYLVPVDAALERDIDVEDETVPLERIIQVLEQAKRLRLVILDACRDNPFTRSMRRTGSTRSIGRGLASVEVLTSDTLIAFAAKAGSTAADGDSGNSPYTAALIKHLATPGLDLRLAFGRVRDEVLKRTANRQEPFVYGSLGGAQIALIPEVVAAPKAYAVSEAAEAWDRTKDTRSVHALELFVARYKDTYYADLARLRIAELAKKDAGQPAPTGKPAPKNPALVSKATAEQLTLWRKAISAGTYKMQSALPVHQVWAKPFADTLASLSDRKLKLDVVAPGTVVPVLEQLDAVSRGTLTLAWGNPGFNFQRSSSLLIFNGQIPMGLDTHRFLAWLRERGQAELNQVYQDQLKLKVQAVACAISGSEGIWFKKQINTFRELEGLRVRTAGMPLLVMQKMGMKAQYLAPGEIVAALERGTLDGAEFGDPYADEELGLNRVAPYYYYPSWHAPATLWELEINLDVWKSWSDGHRGLIVEACRQTLDISMNSHKKSADEALTRMRAKGVQVRSVPTSILDAVRLARDSIINDFAAMDPVFKRVWEGYSSHQR